MAMFLGENEGWWAGGRDGSDFTMEEDSLVQVGTHHITLPVRAGQMQLQGAEQGMFAWLRKNL
jgi:hypothetical protein